MRVPVELHAIGADGPDPVERPTAAVWHRRHGRDVSAVAVWSEKRAGLGEDAEPTFMHYLPKSRGVLAVYDGLGGAGARHAGLAFDGRQLTHAFVASRLANLAVQAWFAERVTARESIGDGAQDLRDRLATVLASARMPGRVKLAGTLRRDLPTTIALLEYRKNRGSVDVSAYWAGDSRCYLLTPDRGLQQVSQDDSAVSDPLELLIADQPMTNLVCASGEFVINEYQVGRISRPCVLLCATDGWFGYVASPALFEYELLGALAKARDEGEWGRLLAERVTSYTSDDASLALVALGFGSFERMREEFRGRYDELRDLHFRPLQDVRTREEHVEARQRSWDLYRHTYMQFVETYTRGSR